MGPGRLLYAEICDVPYSCWSEGSQVGHVEKIFSVPDIICGMVVQEYSLPGVMWGIFIKKNVYIICYMIVKFNPFEETSGNKQRQVCL